MATFLDYKKVENPLKIARDIKYININGSWHTISVEVDQNIEMVIDCKPSPKEVADGLSSLTDEEIQNWTTSGRILFIEESV